MSTFLEKYGTDDPRLGSIIKLVSETQEKSNVTLLGFPYDEGVSRNGGRVGAAKGPEAFRFVLPRIGPIVNPELGFDISNLSITDGGNIDSAVSLETAHDLLKTKVSSIVKTGAIPFVIGGGNDQSYPNALGFLSGKSDSGNPQAGFTVVNVDAHLDVRPLTKDGLPHSGSPFRQLCESTEFKEVKGRLVEFGAQGNQCSKEHWDYVLATPGGRILSLSHLRNQQKPIEEQFLDILKESPGPVFVSFDIDSISSRDCPGVSAPGTVGLTAEEALQICFQSGKHKNVGIVDVSEYNPDAEMYRTGKLVGLMFYYFLMGYSVRNL